MAQIVLHRQVACPAERAFACCTDLANLPKIVPAIVRVVLMTEGPIGVGTTYQETRMMFGREATETFTVTEYVPGRRFVIVAISCGTEFRCEHEFTPNEGGTYVELSVTTKPLTWAARLMSPLGWLMAGAMKKAMSADLDALGRSAEQQPHD